MSFSTDIFYEITRHLENPRDCQALACTCQVMYQAQQQVAEIGNMHKRDHFGAYYNHIRLSTVQTDTLNHLHSLLEKEIKHCYCVLPMSSGKTLISLVYALERVKQTGRPALIAIPEKAFPTYTDDVEKFFGKETITIWKGVVKNRYKSGVYIVDRTRNFRNLQLAENDFSCLLVDEAHTGAQSRDFLYKKVSNTCQKGISLQLIMLTAAAKIDRHDKNKNIVHYRVWKNTHTIKGHLRLAIYTPRVDLTTHLADIEFYPCLLEAGSYYSAQATEAAQKRCKQVENEICFPSFYKSLLILVDLLLVNNERLLIMTVQPEKLVNLLADLSIPAVGCVAREELSSLTDRVVVLDLSKFSESLNITNFSNLFIFDYAGNAEKVRQCVGRLQRTTNTTRKIKVWITGRTASLVFSVIPPPTLINDYMQALDKEQGAGIGITDLKALAFLPDLSLAEITVLCRKTTKPSCTVRWLLEKGTNVYEPSKILRMIRGNVCENAPQEGCLLIDMKPVFVSYRSGETEMLEKPSIEYAFDVEKLKEIIVSPSSRVYTLAELKEFCANYGLLVSGTKTVLAKRLLDLTFS